MPLQDLATLMDAADVLESRERANAIIDGHVASGWASKSTVRSHMRSLERMSSVANLVTEQPSGVERRTIDSTLLARMQREAGVSIVKANDDG